MPSLASDFAGLIRSFHVYAPFYACFCLGFGKAYFFNFNLIKGQEKIQPNLKPVNSYYA